MAEELEPESPYAPGEVIEGKYEVLRLIGAGGMGIVLLAKHRGLDELVAIKLLQKQALANTEIVQRFVQEARAAAKIKGEHCVRMLDVAQLRDGAPYMVMEYLEGIDLQRSLAQRGAFPLVEAVDVVLEASAAIAEAHRRGIVHRDLKASNLFLVRRDGAEEIVKVLDFGISKVLPHAQVAKAALTKSTDVFGSPLYMSPEQMRDSGSLDHRTDIWSLGVLLYELVTAFPPFDGEAMPQICARVLTEEPVPLQTRVPSLPSAFVDVVRRCLAKSPDDRYPTVAALADALVPFAGRRGQAARDKILASTAPPSSENIAMVLSPAVDNGPTVSEIKTNFGLTTRTGGRSGLFLASLAGIAAGAVILAAIAIGGRIRAHRHAQDASTAVASEVAPPAASIPPAPEPAPAPPVASAAVGAAPVETAPSEPAVEPGDDEPAPATTKSAAAARDAGATKRRAAPATRKAFGGRD